MSDLFHESLSDEEIAAVFGVMAACRHTFQVLTKRAARMREWFATAIRRSRSYAWGEAGWCLTHANKRTSNSCYAEYPPGWPLPNVHLGVSVEDRRAANERIPELIQTPAALRFVSAEPLLEAIDLQPWAADVALGKRSPRLDWVIVGGESGPGARPCDVEWIRDVVQQCRACGTPVFVKQLGAWPHEGWVSPAGWRGLMPLRLRDHGRKVAPFLDLKHPKGGDMAEWPADLRVRERPPKPQGGGSVTFVFHQGDAMAVLPTLTERADCVGGER
jgi:protein gp37